jgi:hypothetical protein
MIIIDNGCESLRFFLRTFPHETRDVEEPPATAAHKKQFHKKGKLSVANERVCGTLNHSSIFSEAIKELGFAIHHEVRSLSIAAAAQSHEAGQSLRLSKKEISLSIVTK